MDKTLELDQQVIIGGDGGVQGTVVGVTHYAAVTGHQPNYCVRFRHPQTGLPCDEWYTRELLTPA